MTLGEGESRKIGISGRLCQVFFCLCVVLWLASSPITCSMLSTTIAGNADGFGMGLFSMAMLGLGLFAFAVAMVLAALARKQVSLGFRLLTLVPSVVTILVALEILARLANPSKRPLY